MAKKVVLVNPPLRPGERHSGFPHLSLGYLAAFLISRDVPCRVIDAKLERLGMGEVAQRLEQEKPAIVGVPAMTHEVAQANAVAKIVKELFPTTFTILGGAHVTALPQESLEEFPAFDAIVFGEGEFTLYELVLSLEVGNGLREIKGVGYRDEEGVHLNEPRSTLSVLDTLPFPAWELFPPSPRYFVMSSRGCPFQCNFCMRLAGKIVRKRSPENIVAELERDIGQFGARFIHFCEETFAVDKKHAHHMLDLMLEREIHRKIEWVSDTRVDVVNRELLQKMKAAGCISVGFGIEAGNQDVLNTMKKGITVEQAERAVALAKEVGLHTRSYWILGNPGETRHTVMDTIRLAARLNTNETGFHILTPYPGTEIWELARQGQMGLKIIGKDWADFDRMRGLALELEGLPARELERLRFRAYVWVFLANRRYWELARFIASQWRNVVTIAKRLALGRR